MPSDLKADLRRLVELRQDVREIIGDGRTEALADFRSACIRFDFSAVLQRLEALEAENQRLRECLPSPDMMSGWDDPGAPDDVLVEIGAVCSLRGVEMPDHVREAWRRRGETD